jgi:hypothetical protein
VDDNGKVMASQFDGRKSLYDILDADRGTVIDFAGPTGWRRFMRREGSRRQRRTVRLEYLTTRSGSRIDQPSQSEGHDEDCSSHQRQPQGAMSPNDRVVLFFALIENHHRLQRLGELQTTTPGSI